ncbi:MAG TPA: histidinol-phosphate transaminase [Aldersonia sp.]
MTARIRPDLDAIPSYVPGRSSPGAIKLASNETTHGPLPGVADAIAGAVASANRYPDNRSADLVAALAEHVDVPVDHIAIGCGSVALCQDVVAITCLPGDEVVYAWRSFEAYPVVTQVSAATAITVPLTADHAHDLDAMAAAVTERTRLIFVCNPNNPTGTAHGRADLIAFLDKVRDDVLVVLDEAYIEYLRWPEEDFPDGVEIGRDRPNVLVLRTFSKAYGLAGLRVGYAVGDPKIISALAKVHVPFSVNVAGQAAAVASLHARSELLHRTHAVVDERERVRTALLDAGYEVPPSGANFVWLPLGDKATEFGTRSAEAGVLVRPFATDGVRVTIGDPHENDRFLAFATRADVQSAFSEENRPTVVSAETGP